MLEQLAQQMLGRALVAPSLHQHIEHHPSLIDSTPEPVLHPADLDRHLVQVPFVAGLRQPTPDPVGKLLAELQRPSPHGLVADHDPACRQHLLDHAQAEREAEVQPHRLADHLCRKAVSGIEELGSRRADSGRLPDRTQLTNPQPS